MNKLKVGMKFSNLRQVFRFLGIENEYFGRQKNKELTLKEASFLCDMPISTFHKKAKEFK